ncbi:MAG: peptidylprolyl isomerase [Chloroflexi bacterium]|nr:peptidylprolyl isomerase [Chloroflexota bacterium]
MPKKSKRPSGKAARRGSAPAKTSAPAAAPRTPRQPTVWERLRKNPMALLGIIIIASMILSIVGLEYLGQAEPTPTPAPTIPATPATSQATPSGKKTYSAPPPMTIDANKSYTATIETDKGSIVIQLLPKVAPKTVNSFVFLSREGFYNGLTFHRVEDWVIQGGDPLGTGTGGPGYNLPAEFNPTAHITGTMAMARSQDPNSAGSQFYVTKVAASWLDNQYTVFGQVVTGLDVVNQMAIGDVMRKVTIEEQ